MTFCSAVLTPIILAAIVPFATVGCLRDADEHTRTRATDSPAVVAIEGTPIRIVIGDATVTGVVWGNPTGRALLDQLPVTLQMRDHNRQEKTGPLLAPLTMDGMPSGADPEEGDFGYFAPGNDLVFYYSDAPSWSGIARIGRLDGDLAVVADAPDLVSVTVERAGRPATRTRTSEGEDPRS